MTRVKVTAEIEAYTPTVGTWFDVYTAKEIEAVRVAVPEMPWIDKVEVAFQPGRPATERRAAGGGYVEIVVETRGEGDVPHYRKITVHQDGTVQLTA